jgi:hypothetical protein
MMYFLVWDACSTKVVRGCNCDHDANPSLGFECVIHTTLTHPGASHAQEGLDQGKNKYNYPIKNPKA